MIDTAYTKCKMYICKARLLRELPLSMVHAK
jgi:hypothetical protein